MALLVPVFGEPYLIALLIPWTERERATTVTKAFRNYKILYVYCRGVLAEEFGFIETTAKKNKGGASILPF